ncbi:hypothetical protein Y032_0009g736 [Ancylostoma ceylanicum]|uniref:Uncharacterized protein n=1 Tax=Ancylostoma ceylanicum TaxID=53326 RepID=A0A016VIK9_9BILA|nr:hypothetical protein Y032_0009g736 [Ancylostoma ceylanicum]
MPSNHSELSTFDQLEAGSRLVSYKVRVKAPQSSALARGFDFPWVWLAERFGSGFQISPGFGWPRGNVAHKSESKRREAALWLGLLETGLIAFLESIIDTLSHVVVILSYE